MRIFRIIQDAALLGSDPAPSPLLLFPILFPVVPPAMHRITTYWVQTERRKEMPRETVACDQEIARM